MPIPTPLSTCAITSKPAINANITMRRDPNIADNAQIQYNRYTRQLDPGCEKFRRDHETGPASDPGLCSSRKRQGKPSTRENRFLRQMYIPQPAKPPSNFLPNQLSASRRAAMTASTRPRTFSSSSRLPISCSPTGVPWNRSLSSVAIEMVSNQSRYIQKGGGIVARLH